MEGSSNPLPIQGLPHAAISDSHGQKRAKESSGDSPPGKKKETIPKAGSVIWVGTLSGRKKYYVTGKKNKKEGDFSFNLLNEERKKVVLNLKEASWEYSIRDDSGGGK